MAGERRTTFRITDVKRAVKGATTAGLAIARVEIDADGRIILVTGSPQPEPATPFDAWKAKKNARPA